MLSESEHAQDISISSGGGADKRMLFIFKPPLLVSFVWQLQRQWTHHAQSTSLWGSRNTCKMAEDSQWMHGDFPSVADSSRLQRKCISYHHRLTKFSCVLGMQIHLRVERELHFKVIHTQRLQLQFLLLSNQRMELLALANKYIFLGNGCALFSFLPPPLHSRKMKNPQNEIED